MSSLSILISCSLTLLVIVPCTTNAFLHLDTPAVEGKQNSLPFMLQNDSTTIVWRAETSLSGTKGLGMSSVDLRERIFLPRCSLVWWGGRCNGTKNHSWNKSSR